MKNLLTVCDNELVLNLNSKEINSLYCYYVYENEKRIVNTGYIDSHRYSLINIKPAYYRVKVFIKSINGDVKSFYTNPVYYVEEERSLESYISPDSLDLANRIKVEEWVFDTLFFPGSINKLYIMLSAAINREEQSLPVFNRWNWAAQGMFPGHVVCIADPTLERFDALSLGWYLGDSKLNITEEIVALIKNIANTLEIDTDNIILYGSSGGGFAVLKIASLIRGCTAVSINSQIDVRDYEIKRNVDNAINLCLDGDGTLNESLDAKSFWDGKSNLILVQNKLDEHHYKYHYIPFIQFLNKYDYKYKTILYEDIRGHVGETPDIVKKIIDIS